MSTFFDCRRNYFTELLQSRRHCGHSYSGSAIRDYLAKKPQVCPSTGCRQMLKMSDMVPNKELAKRAAAAARREKEREEDKSDDEEEIIE